MKDGFLDKGELHGIREWLKDDPLRKKYSCPFPEDVECENSPCSVMFPKRPYPSCPCDVYPLKYVVRRARLILARNGSLKGPKRRWKKEATENG